MGKFKRFCLIVFVIAAVLGVGLLAVHWTSWEVLMPAYTWLASMEWFVIFETVLLVVLAIGLVIVLGKALFTPGLGKRLTIERDQGSVSITQDAIQSTVRHVVTQHPGLTAEKVKVAIKRPRNPRMDVTVRVDPGHHSRLAKLGETLQREIAATLEEFTGAPVEKVRVVFTGDAEAVTKAYTEEALRHHGHEHGHADRASESEPRKAVVALETGASASNAANSTATSTAASAPDTSATPGASATPTAPASASEPATPANTDTAKAQA